MPCALAGGDSRFDGDGDPNDPLRGLPTNLGWLHIDPAMPANNSDSSAVPSLAGHIPPGLCHINNSVPLLQKSDHPWNIRLFLRPLRQKCFADSSNVSQVCKGNYGMCQL